MLHVKQVLGLYDVYKGGDEVMQYIIGILALLLMPFVNPKLLIQNPVFLLLTVCLYSSIGLAVYFLLALRK